MGLDVDMQAVDKAKALLGARRHKVKHIPAMPWKEVPEFYASLGNSGMAANALQLLILTLARTSEIRKAEWKEFDSDVWTIPAEKTKTCPCPLKLDHLLLSSFDGKVDYYGKKEIFG